MSPPIVEWPILSPSLKASLVYKNNEWDKYNFVIIGLLRSPSPPFTNVKEPFQTTTFFIRALPLLNTKWQPWSDNNIKLHGWQQKCSYIYFFSPPCFFSARAHLSHPSHFITCQPKLISLNANQDVSLLCYSIQFEVMLRLAGASSWCWW